MAARTARAAMRSDFFMSPDIARARTIAKPVAGAAARPMLAGSAGKAYEGMMIEAVIWDFGGMLPTSPFEAFARFEKERGLPTDIIRRTNAANHLENAWAKFERAEVDIDAFDELFAKESKALGAEVRGKDVVACLWGDLRPEMVEALKRIKAQHKTGCIPNNLPADAIRSRS